MVFFPKHLDFCPSPSPSLLWLTVGLGFFVSTVKLRKYVLKIDTNR